MTTNHGHLPRPIRWLGWTALGAAGAWLLFSATHGDHGVTGQETSAQARSIEPAAPRPDQNRTTAETLSNVFRSAASKVLPAVVVIKSDQPAPCPRCGGYHPDLEDAEDPADRSGSSGLASRGKSLPVLGSGFIVDPSGIVLTNKHVVQGERGVVVQTADGRLFPVKRVKTGRDLDLAVLHLDAKEPLPAARLDDSETAEIGDWVLAIGCPLELEQTVSAGIISAKNRSFCPNHRTRLLQTDAAINPGSSGGPLVNLNGDVIGITTSIASDDGGYQGIGFAIPSNAAKRLLPKPASR